MDDRNNLQMFIALISTDNINIVRIDTFIQFYIQDLTVVCDFQ
jgi:hypothetical protein